LTLPLESEEKGLEILFNIPASGKASLNVIHIQGEERNVRVLLNNRDVEQGEYRVYWNGVVDGPRDASTGTYVIELCFTKQGGNKEETIRSDQVQITNNEETEETDTTGGILTTDKPGTPPPAPTGTPGSQNVPEKIEPPTQNNETTQKETTASSVGTSTAGNRIAAVVQPSQVTLSVGTKTVTKATMGVKEKVQLTASLLPAGSQGTVTYTSSNDKVATVSASGQIVGKKAGKAVITATTSNRKTSSVAVTVKNAPKKITLSAKKKTLKVGKTFKVKVKFPAKTASYKITYTSNRKSVATVDETGQIKAVKKGKAVITVKTFNGKKAKITITVK
jgi:hypothetical protein